MTTPSRFLRHATIGHAQLAIVITEQSKTWLESKYGRTNDLVTAEDLRKVVWPEVIAGLEEKGMPRIYDGIYS